MSEGLSFVRTALMGLTMAAFTFQCVWEPAKPDPKTGSSLFTEYHRPDIGHVSPDPMAPPCMKILPPES